MRAESRVVEVEKQCSMLEFDLKQSVQKMEQLMKQKERLEDEASSLYFNIQLYKMKRCLDTAFVPISACGNLPLSRVFPFPGEESADTGRAGVEQARAGSERPEEPHTGGGPSQVFREAAETGDQYSTRE